MRERLDNLDIIKALAILSVLVLHAVPARILESSLAVFHVWQAVPIFAVLLGVSAAHTRTTPLRGYFTRRAWRLLPAFAIVWVLSLGLGLALHDVYAGPLLALGYLPRSGPGNYYITMMFQFVLLLPLLRRAFDSAPRATLAASIGIAVLFELAARAWGIEPYLYSSSVLRYLPAIVLGMWVASGRPAWPGLAVSLPYLIAHVTGWRIDAFVTAWQPQNVLAFAYPATLVQVALRTIPAHTRSIGARLLQRIGTASYHIFLVQMLWFSAAAQMLHMNGPTYLVVSIAACVVLGVLFAELDERLLRPVRAHLG